MKTVLVPLLETLVDLLRGRALLHLEMLAMRQQLAMVADGDRKRLSFRPSERFFRVWLYRLWPTCLQTLGIFKPDTPVRWHLNSVQYSSLTGYAISKLNCPPFFVELPLCPELKLWNALGFWQGQDYSLDIRTSRI